MSKLTVVVTHFRPLHRNTLRGFCNVYIAEPHLVVRDVAVHQYASGGRWVVLPARPIVDNGALRLTDAGKIEYTPVLSFDSRATGEAFSKAVIAALLLKFPNAFDDETASAGSET